MKFPFAAIVAVSLLAACDEPTSYQAQQQSSEPTTAPALVETQESLGDPGEKSETPPPSDEPSVAPAPINPITAAETMYSPGEPPPINPPNIDDPDQLVSLMLEADRPATAQPGEWMIRADRAIAVTGYGEVDEIRWSRNAVEGRIVFATLMMQNHSAETGGFLFSVFELKDAQGRTYSEINDMTYSMWRDEAGFGSRTKDYYPGEVRKDIVAFVVAPDASGFNLAWREGSVPLF